LEYFLYILRSVPSQIYYIGSSDDPKRRLQFHNTIERGFTARYRPWEIVFTKEFSTKTDALRAEKKVKSWKNREMIRKLIEGKIHI
jgi:putative endonuclease